VTRASITGIPEVSPCDDRKAVPSGRPPVEEPGYESAGVSGTSQVCDQGHT